MTTFGVRIQGISAQGTTVQRRSISRLLLSRTQIVPGGRRRLGTRLAAEPNSVASAEANIARLERELARLQEGLDRALPGRKDGTLDLPCCHNQDSGLVQSKTAANALADPLKSPLEAMTTAIDGDAELGQSLQESISSSSSTQDVIMAGVTTDGPGKEVEVLMGTIVSQEAGVNVAPDNAPDVSLPDLDLPMAEAPSIPIPEAGVITGSSLQEGLSSEEDVGGLMEQIDKLSQTGSIQDPETTSSAAASSEGLVSDLDGQAHNLAKNESSLSGASDLDVGMTGVGQPDLEVFDTSPLEELEVPDLPSQPDAISIQSLQDNIVTAPSDTTAPDEMIPTALPTHAVELDSGLPVLDLTTPPSDNADSALHEAVQRVESLIQSSQGASSDLANEDLQIPLLAKIQAALDGLKATASGVETSTSTDSSFQYAAHQLKSLARELEAGSQEAAAPEALRQNYWLPQGVEGQVPIQDPTLPSIDPADPLSSYWIPNGVTAPESDALASDLLDASASDALQGAVQDIMDALDASVISPVPEGTSSQLASSAVIESSTSSIWQSIKYIAEELMSKFQNTPGLGSLPFAGRVLAYVLAVAGVAFLMREVVAKSDKANDGSPEIMEEPARAPTSMQWPPLESPADRTKIAIDPKVLDPNSPEAEEHNENGHGNLDYEGDTVDVGYDSTDGSDTGSMDSSNKNLHVFVSATSGIEQEATAEGDLSSLNPVLPWMDEDPAGWGPADMEYSELDINIPEPSLAPAILPKDSMAPASMESKNGSGAPIKKSQDPEEVADLDDERARDIETLAEKRVLSTELKAERGLLKEKLWWVVRGLGPTAAVVPGGEPVRNDIDGLIEKLEKITPLETPLNTQADSEEYKYMTVRSKAHPHLLGSWRLEYASNTQVVQENMVQQVLQLAEAIPGFGVGDVRQQLSSSLDTDHLITENTAVFGLGPLGSWQISVSGIWMDNGGGICAKASFQSFAVRPMEIMGISAEALPEVRVSVPAELQAESEWCTTYCDKDFRIGRGTTGNLFVFRKDETAHVQ